jgi:hypothetical protein
MMMSGKKPAILSIFLESWAGLLKSEWAAGEGWMGGAGRGCPVEKNNPNILNISVI